MLPSRGGGPVGHDFDEAEARVRILTEYSSDMLAVVEGDGAITFVSASLRRLLGLSEEELLGRSVFRWVHPDNVEQATEALVDVLAARDAVVSRELRVRDGDGAWRWMEVTLRNLVDDSAVGGVVINAREVTERKAAQEKAWQAEAKFRTLVEQIPAITYVDFYDADRASGTLTWPSSYMSPQVQSILGYAPEDFADGSLWDAIVHPEDRARALGEQADHYRFGTPLKTEYRVVARDGHVVWLRDEAVLVRDPGGDPAFSLGILVDITERKDTEEGLRRALEAEQSALHRLRELDEMKNAFLTALSHELRTPLAAILGLARTLELSELRLPPEEGLELLRRLAGKAQRLDALLQDLLDVDRLARGASWLNTSSVDLAKLARDVMEGMELDNHPFHLDAHSVVVTVDPGKVERILENLISNAGRHTPPGTPVWVRVRATTDGGVLMVEDAGQGVRDEDQKEIFEPFRYGADRRDDAPGLGVGLYLVARFAALHGGRAWVEDREGGGASFRVFLRDAGEAQARD